MADLIELDPALRALDDLARDHAAPGEATPACRSIWPLLAIPSDALSPLDREARDRHLARCGRCRVALADAWLDADGRALAPSAQPLPTAVALPAPPSRRRIGVWAAGAAAAIATAAAAAALVFTATGERGEPPRLVTDGLPAKAGAPLELVFAIEDDARDPAAASAIDVALAEIGDRVPADTRITIAAVHGGDVALLARDASPARPLDVAPLRASDPIERPFYRVVFPRLEALFHDRAHRRAVVVLGDACSILDYRTGDMVVDELRAHGVVVAAAAFRYEDCPRVVTPRFRAHGLHDYASVIGTAIDYAVRTSGGPMPLSNRTPLDLLVLIDGHSALLGDEPALAPSSFDDVRDAIDGLAAHVPSHSGVRIAAVTGDDVHMLGGQEFPDVPVTGSVLGASHDFRTPVAPRYAVALERARHLFGAHPGRTPALLVIATGCELVPAEAAERAHQLALLREAGVEITVIEHRPNALADCPPAFDDPPPGVEVRRAVMSSALPGTVADAVEDFVPPGPIDLLQFVRDTFTAP